MWSSWKTMVAPDGQAASSSSFIHIHALPPSLRLTILNANTSSHGGPAPPQPGRQCKPSPRPETCMIEPVHRSVLCLHGFVLGFSAGIIRSVTPIPS